MFITKISTGDWTNGLTVCLNVFKKIQKQIQEIKKNIFSKILWDKIARLHRKPFGLFYPLETCFSAESVHPKISCIIGEITLFLFFWLF